MTFEMTCCVKTASDCGDVVNLLLMKMLLLTMTIARCHGDRYDQPASRMMVFRDLPDGVEPNRPQHLIIRTGYKVVSLFKLSLLFGLKLHLLAYLFCRVGIIAGLLSWVASDIYYYCE